jgi:hypothetical protein
MKYVIGINVKCDYKLKCRVDTILEISTRILKTTIEVVS